MIPAVLTDHLSLHFSWSNYRFFDE